MEIIGYVLLAVFVVGVLALAWRQATDADHRAAEYDCAVGRRVDAERARLRRLRDTIERGA